MNGASSPARYEIRIGGVLDSRWAAWFEGLQVTTNGGETVISGQLADQAALHGLLTRVRDLGLCLISVRRLDPCEGRTPAKSVPPDDTMAPQRPALAARPASARADHRLPAPAALQLSHHLDGASPDS